MKVTIISPDEHKLVFEADSWEFSNNKFIDEELVLIFYKNDTYNNEIKHEKIDINKTIDINKNIDTKEFQKPSKKGILLQYDFPPQALTSIISKEDLEKERNKFGITFVNNISKFKTVINKKISTSTYSLDLVNNIWNAIEDLIKQERNLNKEYKLQNVTEPTIQVNNNVFYIEEELKIGR